LADQETSGLFDFSTVVIDNDRNGSAKSTVVRLQSELGFDITYGIEQIRSIATVRNHAIQLVKGNYIAIIDDDEFPPPKWLITLYNAIQYFKVDGALGPVIPFFDSQPPAWIIKGKFCERTMLRTGTILQWHQTRTGNVLLKRDVFNKHDLHFDETFKTGGSDQAFFKDAIEKGCRFVAVEEAPVYEVVPPERWEKSYYIKRALVNGFNARKYAVGASILTVPIKSIMALTAYILVLPFSLFLGTHRVIQCLERGSYHLSRVFAVFGIELVNKRNF
jgi:succinoglycan biosynthesis protein ExoM